MRKEIIVLQNRIIKDVVGLSDFDCYYRYGEDLEYEEYDLCPKVCHRKLFNNLSPGDSIFECQLYILSYYCFSCFFALLVVFVFVRVRAYTLLVYDESDKL